MNDIWTNETSTLEYFGEFFKELNSKSYILVIESYLLESMASININLADKFKVYNIFIYIIFYFKIINLFLF